MTMIYFDNAATTFPKPKNVIKGVNKCLTEYCGNPGRSSHRLAIKSSEKIYEAREAVAELLDFSMPENVVFTLNASYALNLAIKTALEQGDHVIISDIEHNSVIRPLEALKQKGVIEYDVFRADEDIEKQVELFYKSNTKALVCNVASNVTGEKVSLDLLFKLKQKYKLKLILDVSQFLGHEELSLNSAPFDVICAPAHKGLFGIQGCGFCIFKDGNGLDSFIEGGSGSESLSTLMPRLLPEHFEAGTLPTPSIVALTEGIKFINKVGISEINEKLNFLAQRTVEMLYSLEGIHIYSYGSGIVSFMCSDIPSSVIAKDLSAEGICVRSGLHCAPLIHKRLGTDLNGTVRISFSYFNKISQVEKLYRVLKDITRHYR